MWNRILGKSTDIENSSTKSEGWQKGENRRAESIKSTTSSGRGQRNEERDWGFNPTSTSYSSTTRNQYPGTASASIGSSYATASSEPTNESYLPPGLVRNASLADQIPRSLPKDGGRSATIDSGSTTKGAKEGYANMDSKRDRRERRDRDENKRESKATATRRVEGTATENESEQRVSKKQPMYVVKGPVRPPELSTDPVQAPLLCP